jgi:ribulose-5-phosphate 4-epimerase/fuculose-1-phosphate aldolase
MIYRMRADVGAICRIHGEAESILSVLRLQVRPLLFLGIILGGEVPVHDFGDLITDGIRGEAVARTIGNLQAVLLRGNGQVVLGTTLIEACARAIYLEEAARMQIRAAALGRPRYYAPEEIEAYARAWDDRMNVERVWRYYTWRVRRQSDAADRRNSLGRSRRAGMKRRSQ